MKPIVDIIEDFISTINLSGLILSATTDGTNTTLTLENPYHARAEMLISIDGTDHKIQSVSGRDIVVPGVLNAPQEYKIPTPVYYHGTPLLTNAHITQARPSQKYPMIYLYEVIKEKDNNEDNRIRKEAELRFFFLDTANFGEWSTDDHYSKRLIGLNRLVDGFVKELKKSKCFYTFETVFTRSNHPNWGVYLGEKGHVSRIFDDDLTGVELSFLLRVRECCAEKVEPPENAKTIIGGFEFPAGSEYMLFHMANINDLNSGFFGQVKTGANSHIVCAGVKYDLTADGSYQELEFPLSGAGEWETTPVYFITTDGWTGFTEFRTVTVNGLPRSYISQDSFPSEIGRMSNLETFQVSAWNDLNCPEEFYNLRKLTRLNCQLAEYFFRDFRVSKFRSLNALSVLVANDTESVFFLDAESPSLSNLAITRCGIAYEKGALANSNISNAVIRNCFYRNLLELDDLIIDVDQAGQVNGFIDYRNITPTSAAYAAYISLISKGWTVLGNPPPAP